MQLTLVKNTTLSAWTDQLPAVSAGLYVDTTIPIDRLFNLEVDGKEVMWLLLKPCRTPRLFSTIIVVIVYYPPGQSVENCNEMINYLTDGLDSLLHVRFQLGLS